MFTKNTISALLVFALGSSAWAQTANEAIPNFYAEPPGNPSRVAHDWVGTEEVDPATGGLILRYQDLLVPGNGGLDISVNRIYRSLAGLPTAAPGPEYAPSGGRRTIYGIGWDLSFGRIWRATTTGPEALLKGATNTSCRSAQSDTRLNPVLELPDGSREVFAATTGSTNAYISPRRWVARCLLTSESGDGGLEVTSPEGIKYTFNKLALVYNTTVNASSTAFHPTRMDHPNGTWVTYSYVSRSGAGTPDYALIDHIQASDGRDVAFEWEDLTGSNVRLKNIRVQNGTPSRQWNYLYVLAQASSGGNYYHLDTVTRPDGRIWKYTYHPASSNPGANSLHSVTTPSGLTATYTYGQASFYTAPATQSAITVVAEKTLGGTAPAGSWSYRYFPGSGGADDRAEVYGPDGRCWKYLHYSASTTPANYWRVGALHTVMQGSGTVGLQCTGTQPSRTETITWTNQSISTQAIWRPATTGSPFVSTTSYLVPLVSTRQITMQPFSGAATQYTTQNVNFDGYGNPTQIVETGSDGTSSVSRTSNLTYYVNTSLNIVNRLDTEAIVGIAGMVDRSFYSNGELQSVNRRGITTSYTYHSTGPSKGAIDEVTNGNSNKTKYVNYHRGVAREIRRKVDANPANDFVKTRAVDDVGNTTSIKDERNYETSYAFDEADRLSGVVTPRTDDFNITVAWTYGSYGARRTLTRGSYRDIKTYDGLGNLTRSEEQDVGASFSVFQERSYNAYGEMDSIWNFNESSSSTKRIRHFYDVLGRMISIEEQTGTQRSFTHSSAGKVIETDQRGYKSSRYYRAYGIPEQASLVKIVGPYVSGEGEAGTETTTIGRNALDMVSSISRGGLTRSIAFDSRLMIDSESHPETGATDLTVDNLGNVTEKIVGSSGKTSWIYDPLGRLDYIDYPAVPPTGNPAPTPDVDFVYYPNDRLYRVIRGNSTWEYEYDPNGNLMQEKLSSPGGTYTINYDYDGHDGRRYVTYPNVSGTSRLQVDYLPDAMGRPSKAEPFVTQVLYWPNGQHKSISFANGMVSQFGQNDRLLPTRFQTYKSGAVTAHDFTYGFDAAKNIDSMADSLNSSLNRTFNYDGLNQIRVANGPWGVGSLTYDNRGNLKTKQLGSELTTINYKTNNAVDTVVDAAGTRAFAHDVYGNVTQNGTSTLTYDDASNLVRAARSSVIDYFYDGHNRLYMQRTGSTVQRYSAYALDGRRLFDHNIEGLEAVSHVYLGEKLIASSATCYSLVDTDSDGIPDCHEHRMGMNPWSASDKYADIDGDGLTALQEYQAGTDIGLADTDGDGISDGYEQRYGLGAIQFNPNVDSDGDGWTNLQEYQAGTNPTSVDTDNDGIPDPLDPNPRFNPATIVPILELLMN